MKRFTLSQIGKAGGTVLLLLLLGYGARYLRVGGHQASASFISYAGLLAGISSLVLVLSLLARSRRIMASLSSSGKDAASPSTDGEANDAEEKAHPISSLPLEKSVDAALRFVRRHGPWWRLGRHSAYRLPWYVVLGSCPKREGDWLDAVPLRFVRNNIVAGLQAASAPYRWRFADEAVIIDARADTDDDSVLWHALLKKLRSLKRRCPVNGVIAVVHAEDLMKGDASARRADAHALRERLNAMQLGFGRRVPVFVAVVDAQVVSGFRAFFGDFDADQRKQFWGMTFPQMAQKMPDHAPAWSSVFRERFHHLVQRLERRLVDHLAGAEDTARSAAAYAFPQHVRRWEPALAQYLDDAFGYSPYAPDVTLRAVGFTAVRPRSGSVEEGGLEGYFVDHFLRHGVFREAALAGQRIGTVRKHVLQQSLWVMLGLLIVAVGMGMYGSYRRNQALLVQAKDLATKLAAKAAKGAQLAHPWSALPLLNAERSALPVQDTTVPFAYRFGLYQGDRITSAIQAAYRSSLRQNLLPIIGAQLAASLHAEHIDLAARYRLLRLYLMLGTPAHADPAALMAWLAQDIQRWPGQPLQRHDFLLHAHALFDASDFKADMPLDQALIARTRATLSQYPLASRLFHTISVEWGASGVRPLSVAEMGGLNTALVLERKSGDPLSEGVPGAYTLAGFQRYIQARRSLLEDAERNDWVMAEPIPSDAAAQSAVLNQVDREYLAAYTDAWDALLDDIALKSSSLYGEESAATLRLLAGPDSPLRALLQAASTQTALDVAVQTKVASRSQQPTVIGRLHHLIKGDLELLHHADAMEPPIDVRPVMEHFVALHRLMAANMQGEPAPISDVQQQLQEAAVLLDANRAARARGLTPSGNDALAKLQQVITGLPPPLSNILATLHESVQAMADEDEHAQWNELWQAHVAPFCQAAISGRYPFDPSSDADVTLEDFTRLFAPEGTLDAFFRDHLSPAVDTTSHPWQWKDNASPSGMSAQTLALFERAADIRDAFFAKDGKTISVPFSLVPRVMDAQITRFVFTLGGQTLNYAHDPQRPVSFVWPQTDGTQTLVMYEPADDQGHSMLAAEGPWGLFRLLDKATVQRQRADRYSVTFHFGKRLATLELQAGSVVNPFDLSAIREFECRDSL
jgi:type VI secretion system protein ImpL